MQYKVSLYFLHHNRLYVSCSYIQIFSASLHYYNINISLCKYFPRILFSLSLIRTSKWWMEHEWRMGIFFRGKRGAIARHRAAKETKPMPLSQEWFDCVEKRKIRAIRRFPCFLSFFNHRHVDDASFARFLASLLVESWFMGRSFLRERSNLRHPTRYRLLRTPPHDTFSLRCFVVSTLYAIATNGLKSKTVLKSLLKWRVCISDNEIVCTLFCIECGKCSFYSRISRLPRWEWFASTFVEIYLTSFL